MILEVWTGLYMKEYSNKYDTKYRTFVPIELSGRVKGKFTRGGMMSVVRPWKNDIKILQWNLQKVIDQQRKSSEIFQNNKEESMETITQREIQLKEAGIISNTMWGEHLYKFRFMLNN